MAKLALLPAYKETGFWLRLLALAADLIVIALWSTFDDLPAVSPLQQALFIFAVPSSTVTLLMLTLLALLETPGQFAIRIYILLSACLFTLTGVIFLVNYLAFQNFHVAALITVMLILLNSVLLTTDLFIMEQSHSLEIVPGLSDDPQPTTQVVEHQTFH